jgi:K+ transporter
MSGAPASEERSARGRRAWDLVVPFAAISVLSAIEGLTVARPSLAPAVVPITCVILLILFTVQRRGTGTVGALFGPVVAVWFFVIAALGVYHVAHRPEALAALSPHHAVRYFGAHHEHGFLVLGSVVLAVTGGEALYADMGHFGRRPIRLAWLAMVMPALLLCYFGQGALVLADLGCLLLVIGFQKSERLASAYGIAVTGTMALTSVVYYVVMRRTWKWSALVSGLILAVFLAFDVPFFLENTVKILDGGWVPVLIGIGFIAAMLIWSKGRSLVFEVTGVGSAPSKSAASPRVTRRRTRPGARGVHGVEHEPRAADPRAPGRAHAHAAPRGAPPYGGDRGCPHRRRQPTRRGDAAPTGLPSRRRALWVHGDGERAVHRRRSRAKGFARHLA